LSALCTQYQVEFILPAHGYVLGNVWGEAYSALDCIARLKAHRLTRDAKVRRVMQAMPDGNPDSWLPLAYDDVPPQLWPVAMRSLLAHVTHIRENQ